MTERQKRFIDFYIETGNAAESARRAGYSDKNADVEGARLLVNAKIRAEIDRRLKQMDDSRVAKMQEILEFMTATMRGEVTETVAISVGVGQNARVERIDLPPKIKDRIKAADFLYRLAEKTQDDTVTQIIIKKYSDD